MYLIYRGSDNDMGLTLNIWEPIIIWTNCGLVHTHTHTHAHTHARTHTRTHACTHTHISPRSPLVKNNGMHSNSFHTNARCILVIYILSINWKTPIRYFDLNTIKQVKCVYRCLFQWRRYTYQYVSNAMEFKSRRLSKKPLRSSKELIHECINTLSVIILEVQDVHHPRRYKTMRVNRWCAKGDRIVYTIMSTYGQECTLLLWFQDFWIPDTQALSQRCNSRIYKCLHHWSSHGWLGFQRKDLQDAHRSRFQ